MDILYIRRFADEMPAAAAVVDTEVSPVGGVDQQVVSVSGTEAGQVGEDVVMTGSISASDAVKDERPTDDGKDSTDLSAARNQR